MELVGLPGFCLFDVDRELATRFRNSNVHCAKYARVFTSTYRRQAGQQPSRVGI